MDKVIINLDILGAFIKDIIIGNLNNAFDITV